MNLFEEKRAKSMNAYLNNKKEYSKNTTLGDKVSLAFETMKDVIVEAATCGEIKSSNPTILDRTMICAECDEFLKDSKKCKICGCYMELKIPLKAAKCPINKW